MEMTPNKMAKAYIIWCYAAPRKWKVSLVEIEDHTGIHKNTVAKILKLKGWQNRIMSHAESCRSIAELMGDKGGHEYAVDTKLKWNDQRTTHRYHPQRYNK